MRLRPTTLISLLGLPFVLLSPAAAGCGERTTPQEAPSESADELPEVPEGAARVFQGTRGDLGDYAVTSLGTVDGRSRIEVWTVEAEEEGEYGGEVFKATEGDEFEFDGAAFTLLKVDDDHEPPYVTVVLE
ncbi:hypothetical protein [Nocardiopsis halophila]|uniref:hypothetical protein n=1 Tax=Nocardiopsis halophila TaxID=141692 RepID=UPI000346BA97|nr:hypothetical protein [Nocardiopsis halophila]